MSRIATVAMFAWAFCFAGGPVTIVKEAGIEEHGGVAPSFIRSGGPEDVAVTSTKPPTGAAATYALSGNATGNGGIQTTGLENPWLEFDGGDWLTGINVTGPSDGKMSVGVWVRVDSYGQFTWFHCSQANTTVQGFSADNTGTYGGTRVYYKASGNGVHSFSSGAHRNHFIKGEWNHLWITANGYNDRWRIYINGVLRSDGGGYSLNGSLQAGIPAQWGRRKNGDQYITGDMASGLVLHRYYTDAAAIYAAGPGKQSEVTGTSELDQEWWVEEE